MIKLWTTGKGWEEFDVSDKDALDARGIVIGEGVIFGDVVRLGECVTIGNDVTLGDGAVIEPTKLHSSDQGES